MPIPLTPFWKGMHINSQTDSLTSAPGFCGKTFASEAIRRACKASWKN